MLKKSNPEAFDALKALRDSMDHVERDARIASQIEAAWRQYEPQRPRAKATTPKKRGRQRTPKKTAQQPTSLHPSGGKRKKAPRTKAAISGAAAREREWRQNSSPERSDAIIVPQVPLRLSLQTRAAEERLTLTQVTAIDQVSRTFRAAKTGLTAPHVRGSLVRVIAALPQKVITPVMLREALARDLHSYMQVQTARLVTDRIMKTIDDRRLAELSPLGARQVRSASPRSFPLGPETSPSPAPPQQPVRTPPAPSGRSVRKPIAPDRSKRAETPVETQEIRPLQAIADPKAALQVLQNTDLLRDFGTALDTLISVFETLHSGHHETSTGVFLHGLRNRFALVVPRSSLEKCRGMFRSPSTILEDVQRLPTTHGIVVLERGAELMAWHITPEYGEAASVKITDLQRFLSQGAPPRFTYEVLGPRKSTRGSTMRDLATFAEALRSRDSGIFPISDESGGHLRTEWSAEHLRRMGEKNPHRVREHLRTIPTSGERVTVREHSRYGERGALDNRMRLRFL